MEPSLAAKGKYQRPVDPAHRQAESLDSELVVGLCQGCSFKATLLQEASLNRIFCPRSGGGQKQENRSNKQEYRYLLTCFGQVIVEKTKLVFLCHGRIRHVVPLALGHHIGRHVVPLALGHHIVCGFEDGQASKHIQQKSTKSATGLMPSVQRANCICCLRLMDDRV